MWVMATRYFFDEIAPLQKALSKAGKDQKHLNTVFLLEGPLGAGKTTFVKEWLHQVEGFSFEEVQSPTFLKILEYNLGAGRWALHMDCYRMESLEDMEKLYLDSYIDRVSLYFIEWPDLFKDYLKRHAALVSALEPSVFIHVKIDHTKSEDRFSWRLENTF